MVQALLRCGESCELPTPAFESLLIPDCFCGQNIPKLSNSSSGTQDNGLAVEAQGTN